MKRFLSGLKDLILRHKILSMICLLAFIIVLVLFYVFCSIFINGHDKYGNRLDGIKEVEFTKSELTDIAEEIEKKEEVSSSSVRVEGKIVYIDIVYHDGISKDKAKEVANSSLEIFSDKEKEFYDFEYILTQEGENGFVLTGTKGPKTEGISYIKS